MNGNHWWEPLAPWHAMLFSSVAADPRLLSDTSRTAGLWLFSFHLSGSPWRFQNLKSVSSFQFSCFCMFKLCWSSCFGSIQRKELKRWTRVEKKKYFCVVSLPENVENNGSELTEPLMRLEQTAHMLVFCRQTLALKAIYLSLDGLGSTVMGALWRKMKHHTLKHEDKWRTWSCRLCGCGCVLSLLESSRPKRTFSFVHVV